MKGEELPSERVSRGVCTKNEFGLGNPGAGGSCILLQHCTTGFKLASIHTCSLGAVLSRNTSVAQMAGSALYVIMAYSLSMGGYVWPKSNSVSCSAPCVNAGVKHCFAAAPTQSRSQRKTTY